MSASEIDRTAAARELRGERARANAAWICMALVGAVYLGLAVAELRQVASGPETYDVVNAELQELLRLGALVVGAVFFLRWFSAAFRAGRALRTGLTSRLGRDGALAFFLPILNLYRPYRALRVLDRAIEPSRVPPPPPAPATDASGIGYRVAAAEPVREVAVVAPPLLTWWLLWVSAAPLAFAHVGLVDFSQVLAATAAVVVIRRIDRRLAELARRVGVS